MTTAGLRSRYEATRYLVHYAGRTIDVRIGQPAKDLDVVLEDEGAQSGVFITAANPRSEKRSAAENAAATSAMAEALRVWTTLPHDGVALDGSWAEKGCFVLDIPREEALGIAERFGQNAIVWCERGAAPALLFTSGATDGGSG